MTWRERASNSWLALGNVILDYMRKLHYTCDTTKLHIDLRKVFREKKIDKETRQFRKKKTFLYGIKFILFVIMSVLKLRHYYIMGLLWYTTFIVDKNFAKELLGEKRKNLLDIWAGSGSITEKFEPLVEKIYCQEPSRSFQKILIKKGYSIIEENNSDMYEVITLLNVIDICSYPEQVIDFAYEHLESNGILIITLPFPICTQSWDIKNMRNTNQLSQSKEISFEKAVSNFYVNFLRIHNLQVTHFTRLPYIVSLPETQKTAIYDNGLFVCKKV